MFERSIVATLVDRLGRGRRFVQALLGPHQVGRTTAVLQARCHLESAGLGVRLRRRAAASRPVVGRRAVGFGQGARVRGLFAKAQAGPERVLYWRERNLEVDFVVEDPSGLTAIEIKSGRRRDGDRRGLDAFLTRYPDARLQLAGASGTPLEKFLSE